jgi:hypothetical protein
MTWHFCAEHDNTSRVHLTLIDDYKFVGGAYCYSDRCNRIKIPRAIVTSIIRGTLVKFANMTTEEFLVRTFSRDRRD